MNNEDKFNTPILFLIYNRPELTKKTFAKIKEIKPRHLFIAAEGPNKEKKGDLEKCNETRKILENIDWPCKVERRFLNYNYGCASGVSSAITWFFSKVDKGIILEDDCLPSTSFFYFCEALLKRYGENKDVMMISGTNFLGEWKSNKQDYHFSRQIPIWGWATWKRAWKQYSHNLLELKSKKNIEDVKKWIGNERYYNYIMKKTEDTLNNKIDSWGYRWIMSCYINRGKIIIPSKNLVSNIGFSSDAMHTKNPFSWMANIKAHQIEFPLRVQKDEGIDFEFYNRVIKKVNNPFHRILNKIFYIILK
ncbi:MAG: hypothetical protein Q7R87_02605 [Nanoarchaeota archaeon]|nr:hypothetical protein [Nanoarchaeota archaeon]